MQRLTADGSAAHLWFTDAHDLVDPEVIRVCEARLSEPETARYQRITHLDTKHTFLVARALLREVLSRYEDRTPEAWRFVENEYGRPEITRGQNPGDLRFNLSHSQGFIALGLTRGVDIGVDVEDTTQDRDIQVMAERVFSTSEIESMRRLPEGEQRARFLDCWTLKESYIKARGVGVALSLRRCSFDLDSSPGIGLALEASLKDDPARWHFSQHRPTPTQLLALAMKCGRDNPPQLVANRGVPFGDFEEVECAWIRRSAGLADGATRGRPGGMG